MDNEEFKKSIAGFPKINAELASVIAKAQSLGQQVNMIPPSPIHSAFMESEEKRKIMTEEFLERDKERWAEKAREKAEKEAREIEMLVTLKNIEANTASIGEIIGLIRASNEKQDEVVKLLAEILEISTASSKEEAESKYKKVVGKISEFGGTVESVQTLVQFAGTVVNTVSNLF